jgi:hypothetical protein
MTDAELLPPAVLKRKAVVYVRQSTPAQVQIHRESQRRQYELVDEARRHGFRDVEVIDDDLGRSASGAVARPGFEKLVAWLCAGEVGCAPPILWGTTRSRAQSRPPNRARPMRSGSNMADSCGRHRLTGHSRSRRRSWPISSDLHGRKSSRRSTRRTSTKKRARAGGRRGSLRLGFSRQPTARAALTASGECSMTFSKTRAAPTG